MVSSAAKRARKKKLAHERQDRELLRPTRQMDPADLTDPEMEQADDEVRFAPRGHLLPGVEVWSKCRRRQRQPRLPPDA